MRYGKAKRKSIYSCWEKVKVGLKTFKVLENKDEDIFTCSKCSFYDSDMCPLMTKFFLGYCDHIFRPDEKEVYFVECYE